MSYMKEVRTILYASKSEACLPVNMDEGEAGSFFFCGCGRPTLILKIYV